MGNNDHSNCQSPDQPVDDQNPQKDAGEDESPVCLAPAEYQLLVKELADSKERYVRVLAEFDNARKRFERDRHEFLKYANEGLIVEFLGVLDDLERSVEAANTRHEDYTAFLKGIELVMARLYDLLRKHQVKPIEAVGKKFDPHCHEVLMQAPSPDHPAETVLEEFQKGYWLGDKVIRTAKVKVAMASGDPAAGQI